MPGGNIIEANNPAGALYAFDINSDGSARNLSLDALTPTIPKTHKTDELHSYRWCHLDLGAMGTRQFIATHIDEMVADALTIEETRPRCSAHNEGLLLYLRGINLNPDSKPEDMVSIRLWITPTSIISVRRRKLTAVAAIREAINNNNAPHSVGDFINQLTEGLTTRMDNVINELSDKVDELEASSIDGDKSLRGQLSHLRRTTIILRRYIGPQRDALTHLGIEGRRSFGGHGPLLSDDDYICLRETTDRISRLVEEMDAIRERCAILHDQLTDQRAEEMNKNMMILSVVAAIFLPLGFLTGLLGVNIGGIPGANYSGSFAIFCIGLLALTAGLFWWFKKKDWL